MATTSELLVDRLIDWGVDTVFGLPGDGINGIFEALRKRQDDIRFVQVRHEEAAAFAACGYAKFTGRLGVCVATSGPGGIHLLNGLYDATMDGQPVLAITGNTFSDLIGQHQQQDVALDKLFDDVAVYSERINGPSHAVDSVDEAIRLALTHRAVAHINVPKDTQLWESDGRRSEANPKGHSADLWRMAHPLPAEADLERAAQILNDGGKVTILAGRGAIGAGEQLEQVAELLGAPIVKALLGKGAVPDDSPYTTGGIGLLGTKPSVDAMKGCDTFLMVGTSFPYEGFYPEMDQAKAVQIDINPARMGLRYPIDVALPGTSLDVLNALIPKLRRKEDRGFLSQAQDAMRDWWKLMDERGTSDETPMKPQVVARQLGELLDDDAIVATDSGTITTWIARQWKLRGEQMFTVSGRLATMACGLPYAVGASIAHPGRQVIAFQGDGGFTMLMGELATCVRYKLPVKIIVIKNNVLGEIKWEQMVLDGFPQFGVELQPIDFVRVAEGFGVRGYHLEDPMDARDVLADALAHDGPALVEALVDPNEPPMPPVFTREEALNFAKALASGEPQRLDIAVTAGKEFIRQVI
jgi:thiamine pyrophosphate-dependent acetolactate synthase large subunit-like protein